MRTIVLWDLLLLVAALTLGCSGNATVAVDVGGPDSGTLDGAVPEGSVPDRSVRDAPGDAHADVDATRQFSIGGNVTGLTGRGLVLKNGAETLPIAADGGFTFHATVPSGTAYDVTVAAQPTSPDQRCKVVNGTGTVSADVTDIEVECAARTFTVGGTVTGLAGAGLVLQDNGGDNLPVSADGAFVFPTPVASGSPFAVTVLTQPSGPAQGCQVSGGTGTVGGANVTSVVVNCATDTFTVGGKVSGLSGAGLVLQDDGGDNLAVTASGTFAFPTALASGANYAVTVLSQPSSPTQSCVVSAGTGTVAAANVTTVEVTCTTTAFTVGGTVTGLSGSGLVLQDDGGDSLAVTSTGAFTFATPVPSGAAFLVTVLAQPSAPTQQCTVTGGSGTVGAAAVTSVTVNCSTDTFTVGGSVTGLSGTGLVLADNGGNNLAVTSTGAFAFSTPVASGASYDVTVLTQPAGPAQTCAVTSGTGTVTNANVTSVTVTCTTNTYTIGGKVNGLVGAGLVLQDNTTDSKAVAAPGGAFTFPTPIASGSGYSVSVLTQPTGPSQTCNVAGATGPVTNANVTSVVVTCTTNTYTVGGQVFGLASGASVVLQDDGGGNLTVSANGPFTFGPKVPSGGAYNVTTFQNPTTPPQSCVVTPGTGSGAVTNANITTVVVTCTAAAAVPTVTTNQFTGAASPACASAASTTCPPQSPWENAFVAYVNSTTAGASICYSTAGTPTCTAGVCGGGSTQVASGAAVPISQTTTLQVMGCSPGVAASAAASTTFTLATTPATLTCGAAVSVALRDTAAVTAVGGPTDGACDCYATGAVAPACVPATCASSGAVTCFSSGPSGTATGPTFTTGIGLTSMETCKQGYSSASSSVLCP